MAASGAAEPEKAKLTLPSPAASSTYIDAAGNASFLSRSSLLPTMLPSPHHQIQDGDDNKGDGDDRPTTENFELTVLSVPRAAAATRR